jgi:hypothetical protein
MNSLVNKSDLKEITQHVHNRKANNDHVHVTSVLSDLPIGSIIQAIWMDNVVSDHNGNIWLKCNGQIFDPEQYPELKGSITPTNVTPNIPVSNGLSSYMKATENNVTYPNYPIGWQKVLGVKDRVIYSHDGHWIRLDGSSIDLEEYPELAYSTVITGDDGPRLVDLPLVNNQYTYVKANNKGTLHSTKLLTYNYGMITNIEYASNDNMTATFDSSGLIGSSANREEGSLGLRVNLSTAIFRQFTWPTPYDPLTDIVELQLRQTENHAWREIGIMPLQNGKIAQYDEKSNPESSTGMGLALPITVWFGRYLFGTTGWSVTTQSWYWRVVKKTFAIISMEEYKALKRVIQAELTGG